MADKTKGSLPNGWIVKTSKKYPDRIYYFNLNTGASTWECPELDPPRVKEQNINNMECLRSDNDFAVSKHEDKFSAENSNDAKIHMPPTAVVVPVVHKRKNSSPIGNKSEQLTPRRLKRSNTADEGIRKKSKILGKEQAKLSPLNRSNTDKINDSEISSESSPVTSSCSSSKDIKDVEMRDVSKDLMEDLKAKKETVFDTTACYYIVVDTNILISELHLISELKDTPLDGCGPPHIFIPWIVIEELDKLKNQRGLKTTSRAAGEAIRYLNSVLSKHPRFHGQSPAESVEWAKEYSKNNDDKVLECCEALKNKMPPEKIILLTNDKNLVNKALICKINVHNFESMMKKVKPDTIFNYEKLKKDRKKKNKDSDSTCITISPDEAEEKMLQNKRDLCKREIHTLMSNARLLLKDVLEKFLAEEMFEAYGSVWMSFPIEKKLLKGILEGIKKYWKMVFSEFFSEKDKRNFELLLEKASRPEGFLGEKDECLVILSSIEDVFRQIKKRHPKHRIPVDMIEGYRVACVQAFGVYCETESSIRTAEEKNILALFDRNWTAINQLCGTILDFYNISHDFDYEKFNGTLPEIEVRRIITVLYPEVQQIKNLMCKLFDAVKNCKPTKIFCKKLSSSLLQFIPSLQLPCDSVTFPFFSPKALERFFSSSQNRQKIEVGIKQIEKYYGKLDEVLCDLLRGKHKRNPEIETMMCD